MPRCLVRLPLFLACALFSATPALASPSPSEAPAPATATVAVPVAPAATAVATAAAPTADDIELAKAHYKTGEIYYDHGRFPDAAHEFEEAYRLSHRAALLYNMGKSYDGVGDAARALTAYRHFLDQVPSSPDRPTVEKRVAILTSTVGRVQIHCQLDGSTVRVDGQEVGQTPLTTSLELNPGGHTVEVAHEGYATWRSEPTIRSNQTITMDAEPKSLTKVEVIRVETPAQEKPKPVYKRWWLWTAVGVVIAAGVVTGVVLGTEGAKVSGPSLQLPGVRAP